MQLRITPGIEAHTHEYVRTGQADSKFGFGLPSARPRRPSNGPPVPVGRAGGLHTHIGSQIFAADSFARAAEVMAQFARPPSSPS